MSILYIITFMLAACSLIYELLLAQTLSLFAANTVISYSLTIGLYLLSMGIGAIVPLKLSSGKSVWNSLVRVEILLCLFGGLSVFAIHFGHMILGFLWTRGHYFSGMASFFLIYLWIVLCVGYLTGRELPLLLEAGKDKKGATLHRILASDYFGSLFAGMIFPLVLLKTFELVTIGMLTASLNLVVAAWLYFMKTEHLKRKKLKIMAMSILLAGLGLGLIHKEGISQYFLKKYYYYPASSANMKALFSPIKSYDPIERTNSLYQRIDLVHVPVYSDEFIPLLRDAYSKKFLRNPGFPENRILYINGDYQFWSDFEDIYHEYFAHIPIMLNAVVPKKVLVLGAGDGLLIRELLKHEDIESITHVELDPAMVNIALTHPLLLAMNEGSLADARVNTKTGDAYHFIRDSPEKYDAIYLDFPYANDYNPSKLYSREFYYFVKEHLSEDGYAIFHAPGIALFQDGVNKALEAQNDWSKYYSTLSRAGFKTIIPYVANLETDHFEARKILDKYLGGSQELIIKDIGTTEGVSIQKIFEREAMVEEIIRDHVSSMGTGFIFISKKERRALGAYRSNGLDFNILNEKRFHLAFDFDHLYPRITQESKINSIMRPTLPGLEEWWQFRMPF